MCADETWPSYLALSDGEWRDRIERARSLLSPCRLCPRECGVDRLAGEKGVCKGGAVAEVSSYNDHHGEEPPISGTAGSGTIFFTHCNLRCVFCQNYPITHLGHGKPATAEQLAEMMIRLQKRRCHNINLVTPTHMMPFVVEALPVAIGMGLRLPLVYNCGGYESLEALRALDGIVDIYMPDMKYNEAEPARRISGAPDYVERNRAAVLEMHRQVGELELDMAGIARKGLLIRHLVLPFDQAGSEGVLEFIAREVSPDTAVSVMSQYFPAYQAFEDEKLKRGITAGEYAKVVEKMEELELATGWMQPIY